jgi:hypothetical protein
MEADEPPLLPPEEDEDCEPEDDWPLGKDALEPPLRPEEGDEGEGMLGELRPEEPLDDEGDDGEEGIEEDEDCCCCGQPPIRNAQTAPMAVACAAATGRDLRER